MKIKKFYMNSTMVFLFAFVSCAGGIILAAEGDWRPLTIKEQDLLLQKLMNLQQRIKTFQGDFREQRSTKALKVPLNFEGRIY